MTRRFPHRLVGWLLLLLLPPSLTAPASAQGTAHTNGLVPYVTPSARTLHVDAPLVPGLDVLAQLAVGRPLVNALAQAEVTVVLAAEPPGVWAHYDPAARRVLVDVSFRGADPRTVAALLSHEAVHVRAHHDSQGRVQARATASACYAEEYEALDAELRVWQELFGPGGKVPAEHAYEREQNTELAAYLAAPDRYWARRLAGYARACGA